MTIDELYVYYDCNWSNFFKATGYAESIPSRWRNKGYIPWKAQMRIHKLTNGALEVTIEHNSKRTGKDD